MRARVSASRGTPYLSGVGRGRSRSQGRHDLARRQVRQLQAIAAARADAEYMGCSDPPPGSGQFEVGLQGSAVNVRGLSPLS